MMEDALALAVAVWFAYRLLRNQPWPDRWMVFQFAVSVVVGCFVYSWDQRTAPTSSGSTLAGLIAGFLVARGMMFLIIWARFGWTAARSMSMSG